jgi:hypothetical protein
MKFTKSFLSIFIESKKVLQKKSELKLNLLRPPQWFKYQQSIKLLAGPILRPIVVKFVQFLQKLQSMALTNTVLTTIVVQLARNL